MTVPSRPAGRRITMWRLNLNCPHSAFALPGEPCIADQFKFCHACDRFIRILKASEVTFRRRGRTTRRRIERRRTSPKVVS